VTSEFKALAALEAENARLAALLQFYGIEWRQSGSPAPAARELSPPSLSSAEKVDLIRRLFRGRTDVYPALGEQAFRQVGLHLPALTSGAPGFARSRGSSAALREPPASPRV
jgi:hypothetical protein